MRLSFKLVLLSAALVLLLCNVAVAETSEANQRAGWLLDQGVRGDLDDALDGSVETL